nr:MAG TPA: hypothetical protein [Caudoviricetes sp.]
MGQVRLLEKEEGYKPSSHQHFPLFVRQMCAEGFSNYI